MQFEPTKRRPQLRGINGGRMGDADTDAMIKQAVAAYFTGGGSAAAGYTGDSSDPMASNQTNKNQQGAGAAPAAVAQTPSFQPTTTVSPNIQTTVSPQISPIFQQSSGGGDLTAGGASQYAGGQSGQGGGSTPDYSTRQPTPYSDPLMTGAPAPLVGTSGNGSLNPWLNSYPTPQTGFIAQQSGGVSSNTLLLLGGVLVVGVLAFYFWPTKKG